MLCELDGMSRGLLRVGFQQNSLSFGVMREKTSEGESKRVVYCRVYVTPRATWTRRGLT
jgi:hypothetical protein